ncbi:MAG: proline--tRNA ligase [Mycoplasma sp.]|nr:proline--tRNA ligase [Mycoplasma sp.]
MSKIVSRKQDFAKWYTSVIKEADLIEYGLVKGTIIFKPYAWEIWSNIQKNFDLILQRNGTKNCYFPLLIPFSEFKKEAKHIKGFAPELFKVTKIGDKNIDEELVIRPTSEISFCNYFSKTINSYNDLPLILNQWCSVFRVEKNTRPFLRTSEFLWQEQHAVFEDEKSARDFSFKIIKEYRDFLKEFLCIPVLMGEKTPYERFAGAEITYTVESLMQDGQALQTATSHYFGQTFAKSFDIKFQNKENSFSYVYQTSAGISTRVIGGLIMSHSDDNGLVLPSKISPYQIGIVVAQDVYESKKDFINEILNECNSFRYDLHANKSIGLLIEKNEIKGYPIQVIIGKKEIESNQLTIYRRDTKEKFQIKKEMFNKKWLDSYFKEYDSNLYNKANKFLNKSIVKVNNLDEFKEAIKNKKIVLANWAGSEDDEKKLKELTGASSRCIKFDSKKDTNKKCFFTNNKNAIEVYFARAY